MTGKDHVLVSGFLREVQIGFDVFIRIGKTLIPRADRLFFPRMHIDRRNLAEGIVGLRVDEVNPTVIQRVTDIAVKGIGVEVAVNSRDGDHHGIGVQAPFIAEERSGQDGASFGRYIQFFHRVHFLKTHLWEGDE